MEIKDANGISHDVVGSGWGTYNTIAGSLGLASFLGIGANGVGGILGGNGAAAVNAADAKYVNKESFDLSMQLARKDSEIALLQSNAATDKKLVDVYTAAAERDNAMRDRLELQYRELDKKITDEREQRMLVDASQQVLNSQFQTGLTALNGQVQSMQVVLNDITTNVIPSRKVCDTGCCGCNS